MYNAKISGLLFQWQKTVRILMVSSILILKPEWLSITKESLKLIYDRINLLSDNQKTALILHKIHKKTQLEVSEIMGLSPKAVESLVQRAKTKLSNYLNTNEGKTKK